MINKHINQIIAILVLFSCFAISNMLIVKARNELDVIKEKEEKIKEIPKVYFEGNIDDMNLKSDVRNIKLKYETTDFNFEAYTTIKIQGTSSLAYEKKNYTINLYEDEEYKNKMNVDLGFGSESKYCLKANWIDKTHARNIVTARIVSDIQDRYGVLSDTPNNGLVDGFPIEVYINGEFLGLYTWNIPKSDWMFNMDEGNPNHIVFAGENWQPTVLFEDYANFADWEIQVGEESEETLAKFNRLIDFVINSSDEIFKNEFENYLDLDASINYFIMLEFAELFDNTGKNMLMATYDGEIWFPSLYDLDSSWGTHYDGLSTIEYDSLYDAFGSNLWSRFATIFASEIKERYFELRKDILTKENVLKEFNDFANIITEELWEKERIRWGEEIPGYDIIQISEFLDIRIPLVDVFMENLGTDK